MWIAFIYFYTVQDPNIYIQRLSYFLECFYFRSSDPSLVLLDCNSCYSNFFGKFFLCQLRFFTSFLNTLTNLQDHRLPFYSKYNTFILRIQYEFQLFY